MAPGAANEPASGVAAGLESGVALVRLLVDTPIVWQVWYALLLPGYAVLVFAPRSQLAERIFASGLFLLLPVVYILVFALAGTVLWGVDLFRMLVATERDLGELQVVAAFCVTATAADATFASIFFRRYPDLPMVAKLFCAFWILMIGWLMGVVLLLVVSRLYRGKAEPLRLGPLVIGSSS
jgi:hypothetical protein